MRCASLSSSAAPSIPSQRPRRAASAASVRNRSLRVRLTVRESSPLNRSAAMFRKLVAPDPVGAITINDRVRSERHLAQADSSVSSASSLPASSRGSVRGSKEKRRR